MKCFKPDIKNHAGFTLLELIVSIALLGIVAVFTLFFIVSGVSGYVFSKKSATASQKARLALARITRELNSELKDINLISANSVKYVYKYNPVDYRYIALVGTGERKEIKIVVGGAAPGDPDPQVLIDQVSNFTLTFQKYDKVQSLWVNWVAGVDDMDDLGRIIINLTLFISSTETRTVSFSTTVSPFHHYPIIGTGEPAVRPGSESVLC